MINTVQARSNVASNGTRSQDQTTAYESSVQDCADTLHVVLLAIKKLHKMEVQYQCDTFGLLDKAGKDESNALSAMGDIVVNNLQLEVEKLLSVAYHQRA